MKWSQVAELVFWIAAFTCAASLINTVILMGAIGH